MYVKDKLGIILAPVFSLVVATLKDKKKSLKVHLTIFKL